MQGREKGQASHSELWVVTEKWPLHGGIGALSATSSAASLELWVSSQVSRVRREEEMTVVNTHCAFKSLAVEGRREKGGISFQRVKTII